MSLTRIYSARQWLCLVWIAVILMWPANAQDFSGRWLGEEDGQKVELVLQQQAEQVAGSLLIGGTTLPVEGRVANSVLSIDSMAGITLALVSQTIRGRLESGNLILRTTQSGEPDSTIRMKRVNARPPATVNPSVAPKSGPAPPRKEVTRRANADAFGGRWEAASDDQTSTEVVELAVSSTSVNGSITTLERGYFSGRVTVKDALHLRGSLDGDGFGVRVWDVQRNESDAQSGSLSLRNGYLVLRIGEREYGYARPGTPLVQSAENSPEAAALSRAIAGRIYEVKSQASGRGAMIGGRKRLAVCSDGRLEYDFSDLASTPGAGSGGGLDFGNTVTRRGAWNIVLRAGKPVLLGRWQGTGTSYSLTEYFDIVPAADGRSALVDGVSLPVAGRCGP
jgi:hypothetical protein